METLNEVIEAIEVCQSSYIAGKIIKSNALHYLKEYRDVKNALDAERKKTIEAYCQWKNAKEKLEAQTSHMMWVDNHFQFEISDNPPLTWDELKIMKGRPVWVEAESLSIGVSPYWKDWYIIKSFSNDEFMYCNDGFEWAKEMQGRLWQAYRKERK